MHPSSRPLILGKKKQASLHLGHLSDGSLQDPCFASNSTQFAVLDLPRRMSSEYLCNPLYYVEVMRHKHPQVLNEWCRNELSNVLDFSGTNGLGQVLAGVVDPRQGKTFVKKFTKNKQKGERVLVVKTYCS